MIFAVAAKTLLSQIFHKCGDVALNFEENCVYIIPLQLLSYFWYGGMLNK